MLFTVKRLIQLKKAFPLHIPLHNREPFVYHRDGPCGNLVFEFVTVNEAQTLKQVWNEFNISSL